MPATPVVHVAVGVIRRYGRVLIARRPDHVHQGGLLEFPGGKVEPGETVQNALVREIREETGVVISAAELQPLIGIRHDYGDKQVFLDVWEATCCEGEPEGREGQPVEWRDPAELADCDFPAANRPIIRAIRLPRRYAITGKPGGSGDAVPGDSFCDHLSALKQSLCASRHTLCLLRAPEMNRDTYLEYAAQAIRPADWNRGVQWMLHGDESLLKVLPEVAGLHMPWREARKHTDRPVDDRYLLAVSCHNEAEIRHALGIGADFITLGPVRPTGSHPGTAPMGVNMFRELVDRSPVVVYGLGGLETADENELIACGAQGIAGISHWWREADPQK